MALPTLAKTWQFRRNVAITATGTALGTNRTILKTIKDALVSTSSYVDNTNASTTPSNMWTVRYSCDSVTAGTAGDGVDRWAAITNLVWANAGTAHSWIVLRHTAINTNFEILISCEGSSANGSALTVVQSESAGFTGGTATARPTATDEDVVLNGSTWGGIVTTDGNAVVDILKSSDGQLWIGLIWTGGQANTILGFCKAVSTNSAWTTTGCGFWVGTSVNTNVVTNSNFYSTANIHSRATSNLTFTLTMESAAGSPLNTLVTAADDQSGEWPFLANGLFSQTVSNKGKKGYIPDLFYSSTTIASGSTFPTTGTQHQFLQVGSLSLPWCQTAKVTA